LCYNDTQAYLKKFISPLAAGGMNFLRISTLNAILHIQGIGVYFFANRKDMIYSAIKVPWESGEGFSISPKGLPGNDCLDSL
jgi:hypothetical protein